MTSDVEVPLPFEGVTMTLSEGAADATTTTDKYGHYSFTGLLLGSYTVTPSSLEGYYFALTTALVTVPYADVTGIDSAAHIMAQ